MNHYNSEIIYGGMDGAITSFATVAATSGSMLVPRVILTIGIAKVIADAYSMGVGKYLSSRDTDKIKRAGATFGAFVVAGMMPLVPFILKFKNARQLSIVMALLTFVYLGKLRGGVREIAETTLLGLSAGGIAFYASKADM